MEQLTNLSLSELDYVLNNFIKITPTSQDEQQATYSYKISKEAAMVNWGLSAKSISQLYRAFAPDFKLFSYWGGKKIFLTNLSLAADLEKYQNIGEIVAKEKDKLKVTTAEGSIYLSKVQLENKKEISAIDWMNGYKVKIGDIFDRESKT